MIYPLSNGIESPNKDLNDEIKNMYNEAKSIVNLSPRASAGLLRLASQLFCIQLGKKGEDLYNEIGNIVNEGCPIEVQQAFDILRLDGNKSVHPAEISLTDKEFDAEFLFYLINFLANKLITEPKKIKEKYLQLPYSKLESIESRDKKEKK
ncbi:MAG: DUF4145 domain-containing protein [Caldisericia bacterium]|nr:DUF4145 domain-containing protein [Caldisericia bacterium]